MDSSLESTTSNEARRYEQFQRLLDQLAGQLWLSNLRFFLNEEAVRVAMPPGVDWSASVTSPEELLGLFVQYDLVGPDDLSLLSALLEARGKAELLSPLYEAGFGLDGLKRGGSKASSRGLECSAVFRSLDEASMRRRRVSDKCKPIFRRRVSIVLREFKELLRNIASKLGMDDISALVFLCQDVVPRRNLEQVSSGLELFRMLRKRNLISSGRPDFLYRILTDSGRLDLSGMVDAFVYMYSHSTCDGEVRKCSLSSTSDELEGRSEGGRNYKFRQLMKKLGDELSSADLENMRVIASSCVEDSRLERVRNVFDLFYLLEEKGILMPDNIAFLDELLEDKPHLVYRLYERGFGRMSMGKSAIACSQEALHQPINIAFSPERPTLSFKRLLKMIGMRLTQDDINSLKFLCLDDDTDGEATQIQSGIELLVRLEKRQHISRSDVGLLEESLGQIGRRDLCTITHLYKSTLCNSHPRAEPTHAVANLDYSLHHYSAQESAPSDDEAVPISSHERMTNSTHSLVSVGSRSAYSGLQRVGVADGMSSVTTTLSRGSLPGEWSQSINCIDHAGEPTSRQAQKLVLVEKEEKEHYQQEKKEKELVHELSLKSKECTALLRKTLTAQEKNVNLYDKLYQKDEELSKILKQVVVLESSLNSSQNKMAAQEMELFCLRTKLTRQEEREQQMKLENKRLRELLAEKEHGVCEQEERVMLHRDSHKELDPPVELQNQAQ